MSVRDLLASRAAAWSLPADFTPVGAPALVVANESTPHGFYEELRRMAQLDGYILGSGCGNVLSMVEAFPKAPRGLVLVDVDPAVVCAGRMLVACLARQERLEDFVREFFCGGEATLAALEREVLQAAESPVLRRRMEAQHIRLWEGLSLVTERFRYRPEDTGEWLRRWQGWEPPAAASASQPVNLPVRTLVAKHHALFQSLARRGDIAVLEASLFDPGMLAAIAELPGFARSQSLVYLSNAADHVLRRAVFNAAKAKLLLGPPSPETGALPRSPAEFLAFVNERHLALLDAVGEGEHPTCFVYSTTRNELTLTSTFGAPRYRAEDLELSADLESAVLGFFGGTPEPPGGERKTGVAGDEGWDQAERLRRSALSLYAASVTGDPTKVTATLEELARDHTWQSLPAGPTASPEYLAFWTAELAYAALALRGSGLSQGAIWEATLEKLGWAAALLRDQSPPPVPPPALSSPACLLPLTWAQALTLSGRLLGRKDLETAGLEILGRLSAPSTGGGAAAEWGGWEAEALLRLVSIHAHLSLQGWDATMAELTARLRRAVAGSGEVALAPLGERPEARGPYLAFATRPGTIVESARWALLLQGLLNEEMEPILTALRMTYRARHGAATGETHVLFDQIVAAAGGRESEG
jgi:hypothetical protein